MIALSCVRVRILFGMMPSGLFIMGCGASLSFYFLTVILCSSPLSNLGIYILSIFNLGTCLSFFLLVRILRGLTTSLSKTILFCLSKLTFLLLLKEALASNC